MRCLFGVDGGGTTTRLRIADAAAPENVLGETAGEGINPNSVPAEAREERLVRLLERGLDAAGVRPADLAAGCLGVAGMDRPAEKAEVERLLRGRLGLGCPLLLTTDADVALVGGLRSVEGMILVAGTGSIAIARLADGTRVRAGGYGHFLSDEGSAFFIGFQAIRRAMRAREGRDEPTDMLDALVDAFHLGDPDQFVPLIYQRFDKAAIAAVTGLVESYRAAGDPLAVSIFDDATRELAGLVSSVYRRVAPVMRHRALVLWGGLLEHNAWLRGGVTGAVAEAHPEVSVQEPLESATFGACMLAAELA